VLKPMRSRWLGAAAMQAPAGVRAAE